MALVPFTSELEAAESLPDLARRLGENCLDNEGRLKVTEEEPASASELEDLAARVAALSADSWERAIADPAAFEQIADPDLLDALEKTMMSQPLDHLGVLRGLCLGALFEFFRTFTGAIELDRGMPIPFALRTPPEGVEWMTWPGTQTEGGLMGGLNWTLFPSHVSEGPSIVLDYAHRVRIDELTWTARTRLPRIATVHPPIGRLDHQITRPGKFFDVRPKHPDPQWLLDRLAEGSDAEIGVLPELCLARPDELEESISADCGAYPPLIVAGSAHVREGSGASEVRANESRVYLDGKQVATHRKIHQFKTKRLDGKTYADPQQEDLSPEPKSITVLSGTHTRLAVLICADLLDEKVPGRLVSAWVNLLLAPAMTRKPGSFETTVEDVSGRCQGVSAVANTRLATTGRPFLCMLGNPRATRGQRFACLDGGAITPPPGLAVYDSADALPASVQWR